MIQINTSIPYKNIHNGLIDAILSFVRLRFFKIINSKFVILMKNKIYKQHFINQTKIKNLSLINHQQKNIHSSISHYSYGQ